MSTTEHRELVERLERLGDDIDRASDLGRDTGRDTDRDTNLVDDVLAAVRSTPSERHRSWKAVAALVLIASLGVLAFPDSRHAVARWFGVDGVVIEIEPGLSAPVASDTPDARDDAPGARGAIGLGERRTDEVNGRTVTVWAVSGTFDRRLITKIVSSSDQLREVTVNGLAGLWVADAPHEVRFESPDTGLVVERVASNTLLWNDGDVLYRVEGFDELDDALDYARSLSPSFEFAE